MKTITNSKNFGFVLMAFFLLILSNSVYSQNCTGNHATLSIENVTFTSNTIEYDIYVKNTGTNTLLLAGYHGNVTCDQNLMQPGAGLTLEAVTNPSATVNFPSLSPVNANIGPSNLLGTPQFRWTNTPFAVFNTAVLLPTDVSLKFVRFRLTSSIPWLAGNYTLSFPNNPAVIPGITSNILTVYCNGNTNSTPISFQNNLMAFVNRNFTIPTLSSSTPEINETFASIQPNPFTSTFNLNLDLFSTETINVKVFDMIGKLIEERPINTNDSSSLEFGTDYSDGFYTVVVSQGDRIQRLRVIKN